MKRFLICLLLLWSVAFGFAGIAAAGDNGDSDELKAGLSDNGQYYYYNRVLDLTETLTAEERRELCQYVFEFMEVSECDLQICFLNSLSKLGYSSADEYAEFYYDAKDYPVGYGKDKTVLFMVYEAEKRQCHVVYFGSKSIFKTWDVFKAQLVTEYYAGLGNHYDACLDFVNRLYKGVMPSVETKKLRHDMMNAEDFKPFHNDHTDRLLDFAGLLTEEQEEHLRKEIKAVHDKFNVDVIVLTAPDADGKDSEDFNDDFYDYGGFGEGPNRDGIILFVNMDPEVRYYTISTCGSCVNDFPQEDIELIYDRMLDHFIDGAYSDGIQEYLTSVARQLTKASNEFNGIRPEDIKMRPDADRVIDPNGLLKDSVKDELEEMIEKFREKYDTDILVIVDENATFYYTPGEYVSKYYQYMGYGEGDTRSGSAILLDSDGAKAAHTIYTSGDAGKLFSGQHLTVLNNYVRIALKGDNYNGAAEKFVRKVVFLEKFKHYPMSFGSTVLWLLGIFLGVSLVAAIKKGANKTVATASTATGYLVPGSTHIRNVRENYIRTAVSKRRRPEPSSSSSGGRSGGGGGGGHYSSSGTHHGGGGGRHF